MSMISSISPCVTCSLDAQKPKSDKLAFCIFWIHKPKTWGNRTLPFASSLFPSWPPLGHTPQSDSCQGKPLDLDNAQTLAPSKEIPYLGLNLNKISHHFEKHWVIKKMLCHILLESKVCKFLQKKTKIYKLLMLDICKMLRWLLYFFIVNNSLRHACLLPLQSLKVDLYTSSSIMVNVSSSLKFNWRGLPNFGP